MRKLPSVNRHKNNCDRRKINWKVEFLNEPQSWLAPIEKCAITKNACVWRWLLLKLLHGNGIWRPVECAGLQILKKCSVFLLGDLGPILNFRTLFIPMTEASLKRRCNARCSLVSLKRNTEWSGPTVVSYG